MGFRVRTTWAQTPKCQVSLLVYIMGLQPLPPPPPPIKPGEGSDGAIRTPEALGVLRKWRPVTPTKDASSVSQGALQRCQLTTQCPMFGAYSANNYGIGTHLDANATTASTLTPINKAPIPGGLAGPLGPMRPQEVPAHAWVVWL